MTKLQLNIALITAKLDNAISHQLSIIINHPTFKALEASWRNIQYIVKQTNGNRSVKIFILPMTKKEFTSDLLYTSDFDESQLFEKIYHQGFGMPGGEPFGVVIGDYTFANNPKDIQLLQVMSQIACAAFAPFITSASAALLGLNDFSELGKAPDITSVFQQQEYRSWVELCKQQSMRFCALVLPEHLVRLPYTDATSGKYFQYHDPNLEAGYLWGNAAYAFAAMLINSFKYTSWFSNIRGLGDDEDNPSNGSVPDIINYHNNKRLAPLLTINAFITDTQEKTLSDLGFIPLCQQLPGEKNVFYNNNSMQQTLIEDNGQKNNHTHIANLLQYTLCACRFAHYLKVIMRNNIANFSTPEECENKLNDWLSHYIAGNRDLGSIKRASFPLQAGLVKVIQSSQSSNTYYCQIYLKPYFQLEQLHTEFVLTTTFYDEKSNLIKSAI